MTTPDTAHRIAYVVPTKDRPKDLGKLLDSLRGQTRMPEQIIIVDGSEQPVEDLVGQYTDLPISYLREYPPSLARQRNAGMAQIADDITIAGYLDDDLVLEPDATDRMVTFWAGASPIVGGAAFSIVNQPASSGWFWVQRFLFTGDDQPGRILISGFNSPIPFVQETTATDWLYGGATIWRREIITLFSYDEWYDGYGYLEDVDYSYRVRQAYKLFVVGSARVYHYPHPVRPEGHIIMGRQQVVNRLYFIHKMNHFPRWAVVVGMAGQLLINLLSGVRKLDKAGWNRFLGNTQGLVRVIMKPEVPLGGHWK